ncbi:MAG TPA: hypothetical protein PKB15_06720 [Acidimicrobiia bacterium]|nr:hypothetical protein [Acidimicrobiia bacterium]
MIRFRTPNYILSQVTGIDPYQIHDRQEFFYKRFTLMQKKQRWAMMRLSHTEKLPTRERIGNAFRVGAGIILTTGGLGTIATSPFIPITFFALTAAATIGVAVGTNAAVKSGLLFRWREERDLKLVAALQASQDLTSRDYGPNLYLQDGLLNIAPTIIKQIKHPWFSKHFTRREQKITNSLHKLFNLAGTSPENFGRPDFRHQLETGMDWTKAFLVALTNRLAPQSPSYKVPITGYFVHWLDGTPGKSLVESPTQANPQPELYRDFFDTYFDNVNNANRQRLAYHLATVDMRITRLREQIEDAEAIHPFHDEDPFKEAMQVSSLHALFELDAGGNAPPENGGHLQRFFRRDPTIVKPNHGFLTLPERPFGHR